MQVASTPRDNDVPEKAKCCWLSDAKLRSNAVIDWIDHSCNDSRQEDPVEEADGSQYPQPKAQPKVPLLSP